MTPGPSKPNIDTPRLIARLGMSKYKGWSAISAYALLRATVIQIIRKDRTHRKGRSAVGRLSNLRRSGDFLQRTGLCVDHFLCAVSCTTGRLPLLRLPVPAVGDHSARFPTCQRNVECSTLMSSLITLVVDPGLP